MTCTLTEQELWSGLDRAVPEIEQHITQCTECRTRAQEMRAGIEAVQLADAIPSPPVPARIGSYKIHGRIGEGGMGIVYEGEQPTPKRLVALKVIRGGQFVDEYRLRLFQREAHTLARLKHPAIAAIYEAGRTEDGQHYFAMELVRGVPLNVYVREQQVPRRRRLELFAKICEAINYAHLRGVIHRDLKPSNILIDSDGQPKILDFGLARISDPDAPMTTTTLTAFGKVMGTLPYMSPEEARGRPEEIDVRSDVYALGVIFYELTTDQLPYAVSRAALHEAVRVICDEPPRKPSSIDRTLRGDLETIALKAIEKEPARRYQSAAALAEDVHRYLTDQPVLARRAGVWYRLRKLARRHKFVFTFIATLFVLVVIAGLSIEITTGMIADKDIAKQRQEQNVEVARMMMSARQQRDDGLKLLRAVRLVRDAGLPWREIVGDESEIDHLERAERSYRNAVEQLTRTKDVNNLARVGRAHLGLSTVLIDQVEMSITTRAPSELRRLLEEAQRNLSLAMGIFETRQSETIRDVREATVQLKRIQEVVLPDEPPTVTDEDGGVEPEVQEGPVPP